MKSFFEKEIFLNNEIVSLVPFSSEFEDSLKEIILNESIWTYMGMCVKTEEDLKNYIASTISERQNKVSYPFIIIDSKTKKVVGSTRFGNINFHNKRLEIGWTWYGERFQGAGLNHACKYEMLKYVFEVMEFNRVQFSADIDNIRSQKAILKLGAKEEGIFRCNYIDISGNCRDDVYFSVIKNDWENIKNEYFFEYLKIENI
jgi:RimJ/RimL family protein N-acetyltransferase